MLGVSNFGGVESPIDMDNGLPFPGQLPGLFV